MHGATMRFKAKNTYTSVPQTTESSLRPVFLVYYNKGGLFWSAEHPGIGKRCDVYRALATVWRLPISVHSIKSGLFSARRLCFQKPLEILL